MGRIDTRTVMTAPGVLICALAVAAAVLCCSRGAVSAQDLSVITAPRPLNSVEISRQISRERNLIVAAEISDDRQLERLIPPGRYTLNRALQEIRTRIDAPGYERYNETICFLSGIAPPRPAIQMSASFQQRRRDVAKVNAFLESLSDEQFEELRTNNYAIAFQRLDPQQQSQIEQIDGPGVIVDGVPFAENPSARVVLEFRTRMGIVTPDGRYKSIELTGLPAAVKGAGASPFRKQRGPGARPSRAEAGDRHPGKPVPALRELELMLGKNSLVLLPAREDGTYAFADLAKLAGAATEQEIRVDRRIAERRLMLSAPNNRLAVSELLRIMRRVPDLHWRRVDTLAFLTHFSDDVLKQTAAAERERLKQDQTRLIDRLTEKLPQTVPVPADYLLREPWANFTEAERAHFARFAPLAGPEDRRWLGQLFASPDHFGASKIGFTLSLQLRAVVGGSGSSTGISLAP